jgi:competence protein ComEC
VAAIDVGQGDSLLIAAPNGSLMLVDAGGFPAFGSRIGEPRALDIGDDVVTPYLLTRSIRKLDIVVATHAHEDHTGGLLAIVRNLRPREVWIGAEPDDENWRRLRTAVQVLGAEVVALCAGQRIEWSGARIEVLSPPTDYTSGRNRNNDSLAFRIDFGNSAFLLTGDIERQMERRMVEARIPGPVDVLKVAHHGSRTSTTPEFLEMVRPQWALISTGEGNRFHHPHPEVVDRLNRAGARILRTSQSGLIRFRTDGHRWLLNTYNPQ